MMKVYLIGAGPVSYTHLDVYKRQSRERSRPNWLTPKFMPTTRAPRNC